MSSGRMRKDGGKSRWSAAEKHTNEHADEGDSCDGVSSERTHGSHREHGCVLVVVVVKLAVEHGEQFATTSAEPERNAPPS